MACTTQMGHAVTSKLGARLQMNRGREMQDNLGLEGHVVAHQACVAPAGRPQYRPGK